MSDVTLKDLYIAAFTEAAAVLDFNPRMLSRDFNSVQVVGSAVNKILDRLPTDTDKELVKLIRSVGVTSFNRIITEAPAKMFNRTSHEQIAEEWASSMEVTVERLAAAAATTGKPPKPQIP